MGENRPHPRTTFLTVGYLPVRRPSNHNPCFSVSLITIGFFENVEHRYTNDVVVMKFSKEMQYRSFPLEGREGEWGRCGSYKVCPPVPERTGICNGAPPSLFWREGRVVRPVW